MSTKRKLPRRDLPFLGAPLEKLSYSKLPTNDQVLKRILSEIELKHGSCTATDAYVVTKSELLSIWSYAGYEDILQDQNYILRSMKKLHQSYKDIVRIPSERHSTKNFTDKLAKFQSTLPQLFDISVKKKIDSDLITTGR